ncbi:threonine--tRNA ligase [candidate division CPR3 bacterium 4484_211]|uniref:Threonine--tRNA ligase n=1 Tax=candidate division CPR3 bacterium 4484_211 TaxID=1968527 RepID=A0A1W9NZ28_UNCC3|nr:MAG: threonine--tRNA ligase [candidate division CPR3 bacterium 4484_211]
MSEKNNQLQALRHTTEHVLTQAMYQLYPGIKMAMGPAIENGFYFDFDPGEYKISESDFPKIEKEMQKIIDADLPLHREQISIKEARQLFKNNEYKQEWLDEIEQKGEPATVYWTGDQFVDLCAGPHVKSTGEIKAYKLLSIAGAYWRGNEKNKMLTRIYGTAFLSQKDLAEYLRLQAEAKKRDHRKIGKSLKLFLFDEEFGQGLPLYRPKGATIRKEIMDFAFNTYLKRGYQPVSTPHIANLNLWKRSGHWQFYRDSMYSPMQIDNEQYVLKPMNCPGHVKIYQAESHSYRDLPLRLAEMGTVYRYEKSGELNGILRPRGFTQDDAHIICTPKQLPGELVEMINLTEYIYNKFGFHKPLVSLSVRDPQNKEKFMGDNKSWELAETALENALKQKKLNYRRFKGEAAFYGPKIDFMYKDALGRNQQLTTIQVDFNLPEKFNMTYIDEKGKRRQPFMLHRALLGSLERFMGVLIEHTAGNFPVWLSPVQVKVIPISQEQNLYAERVGEKLKENDIRVEIDTRNETMQSKIRSAQLEKIPYMAIVGRKEAQNGTVSVRLRSEKDLGEQPLGEFIERIKDRIESKALEL